MANERHVDLLKSSVDAWNKWRKENPDEKPDLAGADLSGENLTGAYIPLVSFVETIFPGVKNVDERMLPREEVPGVNLREADLKGAILSEANLSNANLGEADLFVADLSGAKLIDAYLAKARLQSATLTDANLSDANLSDADLLQAKLAKADLRSANLTGANLTMVDLTKANLEYADLRWSNLDSCDLQGANLRRTEGLILRSNYVRGAQFDYRASDPWSVLRRIYSGPRLLFNLLFLIAFVIPYVSKVLFWASVNRVQTYTEAVMGERASEIGLDSEVVTNISRCLAERCEPMPVWQLILGVDKGLHFWTLVVAIIAYNLLKAGLTWIIAPMRDEEERSGRTPDWSGENGYRYLYWIHHYFVRWVFWIAVVAFALNAYDWLSRTVWIPG